MGTAVDFGARRKEAEASGAIPGSSDYYKLKEGDNRIRLMSDCLPHTGSYQGKPNFKWLCYVIDRRDGKVKAFFMAHIVYKAIEALQLNPDYEFREVPMPYDITISAKKAGTKDVEYTILPARRETPLTPAELEDYESQKPIEDLQKALKDKEKAGNGDQPAHAVPETEWDGETN
jgi:hypothetical protein